MDTKATGRAATRAIPRAARAASKGDGKGKGGFNGYCHWCSEWGHSQSRCKAKDEYMDNVRKEKGFGKGGPYYRQNPTDIVETNKDGLENLETKGGFRALCSLEHRQCCGLRCQGVVSANRFAALLS